MRGDLIDRLCELAEARHDDLSIADEAAEEICRLRAERDRLREVIEDCVDTLESVDMHVDNPLYERMLRALEADKSPRDDFSNENDPFGNEQELKGTRNE